MCVCEHIVHITLCLFAVHAVTLTINTVGCVMPCDPCVSTLRFTFASASPDNIKQWKFPDGNFVQNLTGHSSIINCLAVNGDNVLVSGGRYLPG